MRSSMSRSLRPVIRSLATASCPSTSPARRFSNLLGPPSPSLRQLALRLASQYGISTALSQQGNISSSPSLFVQQIIWGDHDTFQHVNNVRYVRFFESARMAFAEGVAKELDEAKRRDLLTGKGISFILAGIDVKFRRPVTYPDTLLIASKLSEPLQSGADRFTLHAAAYSLNSWEAYQRKLEESHGDYDKVREPGPVCTADQLCVSYDYTKLAKAPLPDDLREALARNGSVST